MAEWVNLVDDAVPDMKSAGASRSCQNIGWHLIKMSNTILYRQERLLEATEGRREMIISLQLDVALSSCAQTSHRYSAPDMKTPSISTTRGHCKIHKNPDRRIGRYVARERDGPDDDDDDEDCSESHEEDPDITAALESHNGFVGHDSRRS